MMILTSTNYLDFDRQELLKIGFTSEQINEVVYGDLKQARLKENVSKDILTISLQIPTIQEVQIKNHMPNRFATNEDLIKLNMSHEEMIKFLYYKCGYDRYILARLTDERLGGLVLQEKLSKEFQSSPTGQEVKQ